MQNLGAYNILRAKALKLAQPGVDQPRGANLELDIGALNSNMIEAISLIFFEMSKVKPEPG
jgi:hypothetical protein